MYKITYDIDFAPLRDFVNQLDKRLSKGSHLTEAIKVAGQYVVDLWIRNASAKFKHSQGGYVQGIVDGIEYPFQSDPLHLYIENKAKYAYYLEKGVEPFDLKKMLETSSKVRVAKDGSRYLIIPFRHGTPDAVGIRAMPDSVYHEAKNLRQSVVKNTFKEGVQQRKTKLENPIPIEKQPVYYADAQAMKRSNPQKVKRFSYIWGERLIGTSHEYEGMVRFQKNVNIVREQIIQNTALGKFTVSKMVNRTDNNTTYSNYMTFRVMSENSTGWIHSGIKAMNIAKETKEQAEAPVRQMLQDAVKTDLQNLGFRV